MTLPVKIIKHKGLTAKLLYYIKCKIQVFIRGQVENRNIWLCAGMTERIIKEKLFATEEKGRNEVRLAIACFPERLGEVA